MAKTKGFPLHIEVTVVARKGKKRIVKNMSYKEALNAKNENRNWHYIFYQKGFTNLKSN